MKIENSGRAYDDNGKYVGKINSRGEIYDEKDRYVGEMKNDRFYDENGRYVGEITRTGALYDETNRRVGEVSSSGSVTDENGRSAAGFPLLPQDGPYNDGGWIKVVLVILLVLGMITVAAYCWVQLLISAAVSVFLVRLVCKKSFAAGKEPVGCFWITFGLIWIPTLIITLCQEWYSDTLSHILEKWICLAGGLAVGICAAKLVSGITVAVCRAVWAKEK